MIKDYEKHVKDKMTGKSYCGEYIQDFTFVSIDHCVSNQKAEGRLLPCPKCKKVIINLLNKK